MSFKSLNQVLGSLTEQNRWQESPFLRIQKYWAEAVGAIVAAHARPRSIQRNVLWVATSSAVWAQELAFGRQRILDKLNLRLPIPLQDIRFSPAQWQQVTANTIGARKQVATSLRREHPSYIDAPTSLTKHHKYTNSNRPQAVFQNWAAGIKARSHNLPLCPQCQCPTPLGELQRWSVCSICAAKQW